MSTALDKYHAANVMTLDELAEAKSVDPTDLRRRAAKTEAELLRWASTPPAPATSGQAQQAAYSWLGHLGAVSSWSSGHIRDFLIGAMLTNAMKNGGAVYTRELYGDKWPDEVTTITAGTKGNERLARCLAGQQLLATILSRFGFRSVYETKPHENEPHFQQTYVGAGGGFTVGGSFRNAQAFMAVNDPQLCEDVTTALYEALLFEPPPPPEPRHERGMVSMLCSDPRSGVYLRTVGVAGVDLERGNYTDDVMTGYDHVCADLATATPCGRLALFDGPPGTGKTFLIRAMLKLVKTAGFVIVPPTMVEALGNPDVVPAVAEGAYGMPNNRMVFLIEDADEALVPRDRAVQQHRSNVKALSSLLNMSDGIMGSMFDVRVIASTNAAIQDIDAAVTRDGRLCRRLAVGPLDVTRANQVFRRLVPAYPQAGKGGVAEPFAEPVTLATVYRRARELGWAPAISLQGSVLPGAIAKTAAPWRDDGPVDPEAGERLKQRCIQLGIFPPEKPHVP